MKHYELFYLISTKVPENQLDSIKEEVTSWITSVGGTQTKQEAWGRKKLAYPIEKEGHGFYTLCEFDIDPSKLNDLEKNLKLHKSIQRFMLLVKKPLSTREILMQDMAKKRLQARAVADRAKVAVETQKQAEKVQPEKADESKIRLDELDKKLDDLLDQDIIE